MTQLGDKNKTRSPAPGPDDTVPAGATPVPQSPGRRPVKEPFMRLGRYEAHDELGRGGMGVVYRGHDPGLDRPVALKTLAAALAADDGFRARFTSEARALARIEHPNVVQVYDVGEDAGVPFFAMEFVQGRSAERLVRDRGPLSLAEAVDLVKQAASGLQAAHAQGIIHRDIKPSNLVLDARGRVKVLDFGLAKLSGHGPVTATDVIMGTPEYMSPEQGRGDVPDHRSDIYALGATLYFLLTGAPPFTGASSLGVIQKQVNEPPPDITFVRKDLSPEVAALLDRLLSKDPAARPPDHGALIAELTALPLAPPARWPPPFHRWLGRTLWRPSAVVAEALSSDALLRPVATLMHVARLAVLCAIVALACTGVPRKAVWRFVQVWIALGVGSLASFGLARATGHRTKLLRHWVTESAAGVHAVLFTLMYAKPHVFGPLALVAMLRARSTALYQAGVTSFAARVAGLVVIGFVMMVILGPL